MLAVCAPLPFSARDRLLFCPVPETGFLPREHTSRMGCGESKAVRVRGPHGPKQDSLSVTVAKELSSPTSPTYIAYQLAKAAPPPVVVPITAAERNDPPLWLTQKSSFAEAELDDMAHSPFSLHSLAVSFVGGLKRFECVPENFELSSSFDLSLST